MLCWVNALQASVAMRASGPVVVLAGEADTTSAEQLRKLLASQMWPGHQRRLIVDVSELSFLDSSIVVVFLVATQTLRERGGELVLLHPQDPVLKALRLLGADEVITIAKDPMD
jgi:anti-anti-sigma factor